MLLLKRGVIVRSPIHKALGTGKQRFLAYITLTFSLLFMSSLSAETEYEPYDEQAFAEYLETVKAMAIERGVSARLVSENLKGLQPYPKAIKQDRAQPEFKKTFLQYRDRRVTAGSIAYGKKQIAKYRTLLNRVSRRYGVPVHVIVAFWGMETSYGRFTGNNDIIRSLATLGFDKRRGEYFTKELVNALLILDQGHISRSKMIGSWSGAMGQGQFMPSSFLRYSQDFNGDGRRDIWGTQSDVFASIAHYLKEHGWKSGTRWGREVVVPSHKKKSILATNNAQAKGCRAKRAHSSRKSLAYWKWEGVTRPNGRAIPVVGDMSASVLMPDGESGKTFLIYDNFNVILSYNCANNYALSVAYLADNLARP